MTARPALAPGRQDHLPAALGHCLERVEHEVEQRLLEVPLVERDDELALGAPQPQLHALHLRLRREEVDEVLQQVVHVHRLLVQLDLAGVAQEVVDDVAQAARLLLHGLQPADHPPVGGVVGVEVFAEELEVELDGRERVLDLVGEPAGERAQLGEALGLARAALEAVHPPVRDHPATPVTARLLSHPTSSPARKGLMRRKVGAGRATTRRGCDTPAPLAAPSPRAPSFSRAVPASFSGVCLFLRRQAFDTLRRQALVAADDLVIDGFAVLEGAEPVAPRCC
jgi:hypothetical protein